jgi:hypothetical protein
LGALMDRWIAAPVVAQSYSEGFTFLKAVRERDGTKAERILSNPSSTASTSAIPDHRRERAPHPGARPRSSWLNSCSRAAPAPTSRQ